MADDKQIIKKPKLGFLDRIRKRFLIRFMNEERFRKAKKFADDEDVIDAFLDRYPEKITILDENKITKVLLRNIELIQQLDPWDRKKWVIEHFDEVEDNIGLFKSSDVEIQDALLRSKPELIKYVDSPFAFICKDSYYNVGLQHCIAYLPKDFQLKLLTEKNTYDKDKSVYPDSFYRFLDCFSPDVVEKFFIEITGNTEENVFGINQPDLKKLPQELQLKIALMDNNFLAQMSPEVIKKFINNNPAVFLSLSKELREKLLKTNIMQELEHLNSDPDRLMQKYRQTIDEPWRYKFQSLEEVKKVVIHVSDLYAPRGLANLYEFGKICPDIYSERNVDDKNQKIRERTNAIKTFKSKTTSEKIQAALDQCYIISGNDFMVIAKIMTNTAVLERASEDTIAKFITNPSMKLMRDIIIETYGEENRALFDERPHLMDSKMDSSGLWISTFIKKIPNLYIFDPIVKDVFGMDFVNDLVTYGDITSPMIIADMVNTPNMFDEFKKFEEMIGDLYPDTTYGIITKLKAFYDLKDLISQIDLMKITDKQAENLKQIVIDKMYQRLKSKVTDFIPIDTLEDLEAYQDRRNNMYKEAIQKCTNPEQIKELIYEGLFGMTTDEKSKGVFDKENISVTQLVKMYNLESFLADERTIKSDYFSSEELDCLEILSIISKINDTGVLKQLFEKLENTDLAILNPRDFKRIRDKVPLQYSKEFIDSLLTFEKAEEMVKQGMEGIDIETKKDGVNIVKLHGANFRMFMHSTGLNNSKLSLPTGMKLDELWKYFEDGVSTISGCPIEGDMLKSCVNSHGFNLGFFNIPPELIVGMSHRDGHVSHIKNQVNPEFSYGNVSFNYPEELVRKVAAQINEIEGEVKDKSHEYGEVTALRQDSRIQRGCHEQRNRRIMPDCIIVYGKGNTTPRIIELSKCFGKNGKPIPIFEIDTDEYGDGTYRRARQRENHTVIREESESIKEVKHISDDKDRSDR